MVAAVRSRAGTALLVGAALVLVALNLRFALAAVPPVLDDLQDDLGLSATGAGLLTTAPVLCFGLAAPLAPVLARRVGQELLLLACLAAIAAGIAVRIVPSIVPVFAGTFVLGIAMAVGNVLMPSVVKRHFAEPGPMMGAYIMSLSLSAALAAGLTVPLEQALGSWHWALGAWAVPAVAAMAAWLPQARTHGPAPSGTPRDLPRLRRDRVAWLVTGAFGLQALLFYCLLAWTPDVLRDAGLPSAEAGAMLSVAMLLGIPPSLVVPVVAGRMRDQRLLAILGPAAWALGLAGLLLAPATATVVWMVLLGIGQGMGIALALTLVVLRAPDDAHAAALSGMAQGIGYALAAVGPLALGAVHDVSGGWDVPVAVMLAGTALLLLCGLGAARPRMVAGT